MSARERAVVRALWETGEFEETPEDYEWITRDATAAVAGWDAAGEQGVVDAFLDSGALMDSPDPLPPEGAEERVLLDAALGALTSGVTP